MDITNKSALIKEIMELPLIKEIKNTFPKEEQEINDLISSLVSSVTENPQQPTQTITSNE